MSQRPKAKPTTPLPPITNRINELRIEQRIQRTALAYHVGITRQALYNIETQQSLPNLETAFRIARYLSCSIEDVFVCDWVDEDINPLD